MGASESAYQGQNLPQLRTCREACRLGVGDPAVDRILGPSRTRDYGLGSLIHAIVQGEFFLME
jgi:hypothetical protein